MPWAAIGKLFGSLFGSKQKGRGRKYPPPFQGTCFKIRFRSHGRQNCSSKTGPIASLRLLFALARKTGPKFFSLLPPDAIATLIAVLENSYPPSHLCKTLCFFLRRLRANSQQTLSGSSPSCRRRRRRRRRKSSNPTLAGAHGGRGARRDRGGRGGPTQLSPTCSY